MTYTYDIKRLFLMVFVFFCSSVIAESTTDSLALKKPTGFIFTGVLQDSLFMKSDSVSLEVLESGEQMYVVYATPFELILPFDSLWNICFSDTQKEKCYEITHTTTDSVFHQAIGDAVSSEMLFDNREEEVELTAYIDTTAPVMDSLENDLSNDLNQTIEKRTKLRKTVVRLRKRPKRALGKTTISAKSIRRMPSLAEADVIKSIQALPGVVASSDFSSKLYVRGASSDQNLFLFDNGIVYSPIHFFGLFSTFLVEGIDEVNFYKGGFSPEYGNRLASVVDVHSRKGGNDSANTYFTNSTVKISTFAGQLHWEGRHDNVRWLMAGRMTWFSSMLDAFRWVGLTDLEIDYDFWDLQGNVAYDFSEDESIMTSMYRGEDELDFGPFKVGWGNELYATNYIHNNVYENVNLSGSASYSKFHQMFGLQGISSFKNEMWGVVLKGGVRYTGMSDQQVTVGVESQLLDIAFIQEFKGGQSNDSAESEASDFTSIDQYDFWLHSTFIEDKYTAGDITITPGLRASLHSDLMNVYFEPRISFQFQLPAKQVIDFHLGHYKQFINNLQFSDQESINEFYYPTRKTNFTEMKPSESNLLSLGFFRPQVLGMFDVTLETYYKTFKNLYVFDINGTADSIVQSRDNVFGDFFKMGEGYSYGFEALIRKDAGKVFGGVSYTYGRSIVQDLGSDATGDEKQAAAYSANWDQTHSVKIDAGINWRGKDGIWKHSVPGRYWNSSIAIKYATGLPYSEVAGHLATHEIDQGNGVSPGGPTPGYENNTSVPLRGRNEARYPPYFRFDIKLFDIGREGKWNLSFTIINVTNHENVFQYFYDTSGDIPIREEFNQLPFLPVFLNYEYRF